MAKKRLNTKLLIILASAVAVLAVGLVIATNWYRENAGRAVRRAQEFEAAGEYGLAAGQWEKAYRATNDSQYRLSGIEALSYNTSGPEGDEAIQAIYSGLNNLVASDPGDLSAIRPLLRLYARGARFGGGSPGRAVEEVRRLARLVLAQQPDDAEAKIYDAAATLALTNVSTQQIPEEEVEAARAALRETVPVTPIDGTGVTALLADLQRQFAAGGIAATELMEGVQAMRETLAQVADAAGEMTPREGIPTDVAAVRTTVSRGYSVLSQWAAQLARDASVREALGEEAARALPVELRDAALAEAAAAIESLDADRDKYTDDFLEAHLYRASLQTDTRDFAAAEQTYATLSELRPWDPRVAKAHGDFLMDRNRPAEAAAVLRANYATRSEPLPEIKGPAGATARQVRALAGQYLADAVLAERDATSEAARRAELLEEARAALSESAAARRQANIPEQRDAQRIEAQLEIAAGQPYEGLRLLAAALRTSGDFAGGGDRGRGRARLLRLLADTNRQLNQPGTELEYLEQLQATARQFMRLGDYLRLAELYATTGRADDARQIASFLSTLAPDNSRVQLLQAQLAPREEATAAYEAMPEETESELRSKLQLAVNTNRVEESRRLGERLLEVAPDDERVAIAVAQIMVRAGDSDAARSVLGRYPDSQAAQLILEQLEGMASGGEARFDSLPPEQRLRLEARLAASRGDEEEAIAKLQQAAELSPDNPEILDPLFRALLATGRAEDARPLLPSLVTSARDGVGGETYRIELLLAEGETQAALQAAEALYNQYDSALPAARLYADALAASANAGGDTAARAVEVYEQALRIAPQDERSLAGIVGVLERAGRAEEAKPYIDRGLRVNPRNATLVRAAIGYELRYGDPSRILDVRRTAVEENPDDPAVRQALVDTLALAARGAANQDEPDRAQTLAQEAVDAAAAGLERSPESVGLLRSLVAAAPLAGDDAVARAKAILEERMTPSSSNSLIAEPAAVSAAAALLANTGDASGAEAVIRRHLAATPEAPARQRSLMLAGLAQLLEGQGQTQAALEVLEATKDQPAIRAQRVRLLAQAAARRDPNVPDALGRLRDEVAAADASDEPLSAGMLTTAAAAELDAGDPGRAQELASRAAQQEPGRSDTLYIQGIVALRQPAAERDLADAEAKLAQAVQANPRNVEAMRTLAEARLLRGDPDGAADALARLLDVRPDDVRARLGIVRLAMTQVPPDYGAADRQFRAAEAAGVGDNPQILISRAQMAERRGNLDDAIRYAQEATQAAANLNAGETAGDADLAAAPAAYVQAYTQLLVQAGRERDAIPLLDRVIAADGGPATWWARNSRAAALASAGRIDEARPAFEEAYRAANEASPAAAEATLAAAQAGVDHAFAYGLIADAVAAEGADPRLLLTASRLATRAGDLTAAADLVTRARARSQDLGQLDENAELGYELQLGTIELQMEPPQLEQAMERFRNVLAKRPTSEAAANNLAYAITLHVAAGGLGDDEATRLLREADRFGEIALTSAQERARQTGTAVNPNVADSAAWASTLLAIRTDNPQDIEAGLRRLEAVRSRAASDDEDFPELYYHIARAHEALDNLVAARTAVQTGMDLLDRRAAEPGGPRPSDSATRRRLEALSAELKGE